MYRARQVPDFKDVAAVRAFLTTELQSIAAAGSQAGEFLQLRPLQVAPTKVWDGMVVLAAGAWNPGSGPGYYGYRAGSWRFLG